MKHDDKLTMKDFTEQLAKAIVYADRQLEAYIHADGLLKELPSEFSAQLLNDALALTTFMHLVVGACEAGVISREAILEYVSVETGKRGAAQMEEIFEKHAGCWAAIVSSTPKHDYIPPTGDKPNAA